MDIRVISTGHIFHQVDSKIAQLLLELLPAAVERAEFNKPAVPIVDPSEVRFFVRKNPYSGLPQIVMQQGSLEEIYAGPSDNIPTFGGKARRECPLEVANLYRVALGKEIQDPHAYNDMKNRAKTSNLNIADNRAPHFAQE